MVKRHSKENSLTNYQKAHKRAEIERLKMIKEDEKEKARKAKIIVKEQQRLERQQKKEAADREKELRRIKRQEEQKKRDEEKEFERKKKEEEKRRRDEEKLQKEQERRREEEFKIKQEEKQRAVLLGFLVKSEAKKEGQTVHNTSCGPFIQFELSKDMRMPPVHRMPESVLKMKRQNLDHVTNLWNNPIGTDTASSLGLRKFGRTDYLHELNTRQIKPLSYPSTWPTEAPDVQYLGENLCLPCDPSLKVHGTRGTGGTVWLRAKLFQFIENYRPAYYGTWRRRSRIVTGRRPFARDNLQLDYVIDSDDEWEEEEPGESITQSDNEEEEEERADDEDEEDDAFFVPHGYLSDDEGVEADDGEDCSLSDEMKKLRQRLSMEEYEAAHRRGLHRLKPLLIGPIWLPEPVALPLAEASGDNIVQTLDDNKENIEAPSLVDLSKSISEKLEFKTMRLILNNYRVHAWTSNLPICVHADIIPTKQTAKRQKKSLPEEATPHLIYLIHRSPLGKLKLAFEFRVFWHRHTTGSLPDCTRYAEYKRYNANMGQNASVPLLQGPGWDNLALSQSLILHKLAEIAIFEDGCWVVYPYILRKFAAILYSLYGIEELNKSKDELDNEFLSTLNFPPWSYLTDVVCNKMRSGRLSAVKRRSLDTATIVITDTDDIVSGLEAVPEHSSTTVTPSLTYNHLVKETGNKSNAKLKSNAYLCQTDDDSGNQESALSPQKTVISSRKRTTLDAFFTPPTKRTHIDTSLTSSAEKPVLKENTSTEIFITIDSD